MRFQWNKLGVNKHPSPAHTVAVAAFFCPECGSEIYGEWVYTAISYMSYNKDKDPDHELYCKMQSEAQTFIFMAKCPCCGGELRRTEGYFHQAYFGLKMSGDNFFTAFALQSQRLVPLELNHMFFYMDNLRAKTEPQEIKQQAQERLSTYLSKEDFYTPTEISSDLVTSIRASSDELKKYLQQATKLESNVFELTNRLRSLYEQQYTIRRRAKCARAELIYEAHQEVAKKELQLADSKRILNESKTAPLPEVQVTKPQKPTPPVLRTPNIFNRKKVEQENQELQEQYVHAKGIYEERMKAALEEEARIRAENQRVKAENIRKHELQVEECCKKLDELRVAEAENVKSIESRNDFPALFVLEALETEIDRVETLLAEMIRAKNDLYSCDIIFEKYRHFVAIATISEYFITGRCSSLDGANGAYNLYETESRANTVISQLSRIGDAIEQLKETQYVLYSELCKANSNIENMQVLTNAAVQSISSTNEHLKRIERSAEITAYNTAVDAYYSKMHTEMLSSMRIYGAIYTY